MEQGEAMQRLVERFARIGTTTAAAEWIREANRMRFPIRTFDAYHLMRFERGNVIDTLLAENERLVERPRERHRIL